MDNEVLLPYPDIKISEADLNNIKSTLESKESENTLKKYFSSLHNFLGLIYILKDRSNFSLFLRSSKIITPENKDIISLFAQNQQIVKESMFLLEINDDALAPSISMLADAFKFSYKSSPHSFFQNFRFNQSNFVILFKNIDNNSVYYTLKDLVDEANSYHCYFFYQILFALWKPDVSNYKNTFIDALVYGEPSFPSDFVLNDLCKSRLLELVKTFLMNGNNMDSTIFSFIEEYINDDKNMLDQYILFTIAKYSHPHHKLVEKAMNVIYKREKYIKEAMEMLENVKLTDEIVIDIIENVFSSRERTSSFIIGPIINMIILRKPESARNILEKTLKQMWSASALSNRGLIIHAASSIPSLEYVFPNFYEKVVHPFESGKQFKRGFKFSDIPEKNDEEIPLSAPKTNKAQPKDMNISQKHENNSLNKSIFIEAHQEIQQETDHEPKIETKDTSLPPLRGEFRPTSPRIKG